MSDLILCARSVVKRCKRCQETKPLVYGFYSSTAGTRDGRMNVCRDCFNARRRQRYAETR